MRTRLLATLAIVHLACLASAGSSPPGERTGTNLLANPGFEEKARVRQGGWEVLNGGFQLVREGREGGWCIRCDSDNVSRSLGAQQAVVFDPPTNEPLLFSAWSKTSGMEGHDYAMVLNVFYADGTSSWGHRIHFPRLAGDWTRGEAIFTPEKPVRRVVAVANFERAKGTAWFDDITVAIAPHRIRGHVWDGLTGEGRVVALASSDLPAAWSARILVEGREVFSQAGEGRTFRIEWDGLDASGRPTPGAPRTTVIEATDKLRGEKARLTRTGGATPAPPGRSYALWTVDSMTRVLPGDLPPGEEVLAAITLAAARNEAESAQVVLLPASGRPLRNVRLKPSPLTGPSGAVIGADQVRWQQVGYVRLGEHAKGHPFIRRAAPGWWPDPLLPVARFDVEPGWSQPAWVTVTVPPDAAAGTYKGFITVSADGNPDSVVPIELSVHPFTLPAENSLRNTFALMRGYLEKVYGREHVTPELRRAYGDFMLAHRLTPDDITGTDLPDLGDLEHYRSRGLGVFNVVNLVEPRKGEWNCFSPVAFYTPAFRQHLIGKLDPFVAQLRARGLADKAYVYGFDEREGDYNPVIREYFGLIKDRYGLRTMTTAKLPLDPKVLDNLNVDWICPLTPAYSLEAAERCRAAGKQVWSYVCLGPRHPYANFLADDPLIEARVIAWQAFQQKFDGFLYWGVNVWWHKNTSTPIDPSKGPRLDWSITTNGMSFLHGDGVLIYPLVGGRPAGSIRLANLRDGMEDYEYLRALGQAKGDIWSAREDCAPVTASLTSFTRDPAALLAARQRVAQGIVRRMQASPGAEGR